MLYVFLGLILHASIASATSAFSCKANYDELDIPHQETKSLEEFYFCFGHHHGADRAWAMDFFRRVGQGRNAEVLGFSQLKSDLMMKLLDLPTLAKKIWNEFSPESKKWLEIYAEGVNEGFKIGKKSHEFRDLNFEPEDWKGEDTLLVLLLQSFDQTRKTFFRDYEEEKNLEKWGEKAPVLFDVDGMPWENNILKEGEYPRRENLQTNFRGRKQILKLWGEFPTLFGLESGSNNWAVSAKKSKSGKAILANDPHLDLKTPMFWYWMHLKSPGLNVVGGSVPGVPVIATGTNGKVAWGLTNSYLNSADIFYIDDLKEKDVVSFRPLVYVKFWFFKIPFFFKSFERLASGLPILPLETKRKDKLVLRWSGFRLKAQDLYPMLDLAFAKDVSEMDEKLKRVGIPSWNFVFADHHGDIGFRLVGNTYRETEKTPFGISTKKLSDLSSERYLAPDERPGILRPKRGYVYTANNRHWPMDAKFYGGRAYSNSLRGGHIDKLIKDSKHDVESFKKIQCNRDVVDAKFFLPKLRQNLILKELDNWDMLAHDDSTELPLFRRLMDLAMEKWAVNEYALYRLLGSLTIEQTRELEEMYKLAKKEIGGRNWKEIHLVSFPHLSKNSAWVFSPEIPGVGDTHSIDPGTSQWNPERRVYEQNAGASMRMVIELGARPEIHLILPGRNRNYAEKSEVSPWEAWRSCQYTSVQY